MAPYADGMISIAPSPNAVCVAVAQFAPTTDAALNLRTIRELVSSAQSRGARLVVLPEYSSYFADPVGQSFLTAAEPLDGPFVTALSGLADEFGVYVVAGMSERAGSGHGFHNTLVAVAPERGLVATYRKQHLYDAFGARESEWVLPGQIAPVQVFDIDGLRVGMQTCYDLRFPELTRTIVDAGAELILVPAEWVRGPLKEHHWRTLITARAIENTVYVAAADHVAPVGVGCSMIVDPMGVTIADAGEIAGAVVAAVDRDRITQVRRSNPALRLRRYRVEPR